MNDNNYNSITNDSDINHFTSLSTKRSSKWFVPVIEHYFTKMVNLNNIEDTRENLNAANGIYSEATKEKFLKLINASKYIEEVKNLDVLEEIDIIVPITRRIIGEFIRQPDNDYTCVINDPDVTMNMNKEAANEISNILMEKLMIILKEQSEEAKGDLDTNDPKANAEYQKKLQNIDLDEELEKVKTKYFNDEAAKSKAFVDSAVNNEDLVNALVQQFFYMYATEKVFTFIDTSNNKVELTHLPPDTYFRYPSSLTNDVEDDIAGMWEFEVPFYEFKDKYKDRFSKEDYEYILTLIDSSSSKESKADIIDRHFNSYYGDAKVDEKASYIDGISDAFRSDGNIKLHKMVFRSKRKYGILSKMELDGTITEIAVSENYKVNPAMGDIEVEWIWKDEVFDTLIAGNIKKGIYAKPEPLTHQREFLDNVNTVKIPVVGKSGLLVNYVQKPISRRLLPFNIIYKFLHIKIQSEISKFQGFINIIPESVFTTSEHFTLDERLDYLFESNLAIIDDSQVGVNALQAMRTIGNYHKEYITQLQDIQNSIKSDAWEMADMNNERYGEIDTRGGQGNTREAIIRVSTGSLLLFHTFDNYLERLYQAIADYSRLVSVNGFKADYQDKDGKIISVDYDHNTLLNRGIGIFFKKSQLEREKKEAIQQNVVQAAMQNNEFLLAMEAIDSDNVHNVKEIAKKIDEGNKERETYFKELENQIANAKIEREDRKDTNEYKLKTDVEHIKGDYGLLEKDKDLQMKMIEFSSFNPDNNKYADDISSLEKEINAAEIRVKESQVRLNDAKAAEARKPKPATK